MFLLGLLIGLTNLENPEFRIRVNKKTGGCLGCVASVLWTKCNDHCFLFDSLRLNLPSPVPVSIFRDLWSLELPVRPSGFMDSHRLLPAFSQYSAQVGQWPVPVMRYARCRSMRMETYPVSGRMYFFRNTETEATANSARIIAAKSAARVSMRSLGFARATARALRETAK